MNIFSIWNGRNMSDDELCDIHNRREEDKLPPTGVVTEATLKLGRSIRRWLAVLTGLTVVLYLIIAGLLVWTDVQSDKNADALCALYEDAVGRADAGARFLTENPRGLPGFTVEQIQTSINNSRATARSLSTLHCPLPPEPSPTP
jgi:hypothetical protein